MEALAGMSVVLMLFLVVLAILWICMPFALFGTKPILRELLAEQKETNRLLRQITDNTSAPVKSLVSERYRDN